MKALLTNIYAIFALVLSAFIATRTGFSKHRLCRMSMAVQHGLSPSVVPVRCVSWYAPVRKARAMRIFGCAIQ